MNLRLASLSLACLASAAGAQLSTLCPKNQQPDYGYDGIECYNCEVSGRGQPWIVFHREPRIRNIRHAGPADGKLREGDTLVSIDGLAITTRAAAERYASAKAGDTVQFVVRRSDGTATVSIVAGAKCAPGTPLSFSWTLSRDSFRLKPMAFTSPLRQRMGYAWTLHPGVTRSFQDSLGSGPGWIGIGLVRVLASPDDLRAANINESLFRESPEIVAIAPNSPAEAAGLLPGDTLVAVNGAALTSAQGARLFLRTPAGAPLEITIRRKGETKRVTVTPRSPPGSINWMSR